MRNYHHNKNPIMHKTIEELKDQYNISIEEIDKLRKLAIKFYSERQIDTEIRDLLITDLIKEIKRTIALSIQV